MKLGLRIGIGFEFNKELSPGHAQFRHQRTDIGAQTISRLLPFCRQDNSGLLPFGSGGFAFRQKGLQSLAGTAQALQFLLQGIGFFPK